MSAIARTLAEAVERLNRRDPTLKQVFLVAKQHTDSELAELTDCLLAHPDVVTRVFLAGNKLTDETGIKLARYLAASSTVQWLSLGENRFSSATHLAMAAALRVNSSLQLLYLFGNQALDRTQIDAAFVEALWLNPVRPAESMWRLYSFDFEDLNRLKPVAEQRGHPSLQLLLAMLC